MKSAQEIAAETRSISNLAADALAVQNACNLSGVAYSFAGAMSALWAHAHATGMGTGWVNQHAITRAYLCKLVSLSGCESINVQIDALRECAKIKEAC